MLTDTAGEYRRVRASTERATQLGTWISSPGSRSCSAASGCPRDRISEAHRMGCPNPGSSRPRTSRRSPSGTCPTLRSVRRKAVVAGIINEYHHAASAQLMLQNSISERHAHDWRRSRGRSCD
jgi:hypothetical protein